MRTTSIIRLVGALSSVLGGAATTTKKLSTAAQNLFDFSMSVNDVKWDDSYKALMYPSNGVYNLRFTAWWTAGLLHRNTGDDVKKAKEAIRNTINNQMNEDFNSPWYGDYKKSSDQPIPQSPLYPPKIYSTYDPNWREFIGAQLAQNVAEFEHLLGPDLVKEIEESLVHTSIGSMRRNGTFPQDDNLTLGYTNPSYMRAFMIGWLGYRINNQTFIDYADDQGTKLFKLFSRNGANTLSEYNCPTYYGMDAWALACLAKYGNKASTATKHALPTLKLLMEDLADHYNPYLGNMVGPYDRAHNRDMTMYNSVVSFLWWGIFGEHKTPHPNLAESNLQYDVAQGAAIALVMDTVESILSPETKTKLTTTFTEERLLNKTIYDDLDTDTYRISTSWLSKSLMIGGTQIKEDKQRGEQFTPAIVHWATDPDHKPFPYIGFFSLYPTATTITAIAEANRLTITYPNPTQAGSGSFQFLVSSMPPPWIQAGNVVDGFRNLPCLKVGVSAPGLVEQPTTYGGTIYSHFVYNIVYTVPEGFEGIPQITFDLKYTC